jgi:GTPase SAR1 family protein
MGCGESSANHEEQTQKQIIDHKPKPAPIKDGVPITKGAFKETDATTKILTLGAGECGKTTLWRQLKIIYCNGFSDAERTSLSNALKTNILGDIIALIQYAQGNNQNIPNDIESDVEAILACDAVNPDDFTEEIAQSIERVWDDPIIKQVYQQANSIGIGENADYFLDNVKRIAAPDYVPTNDDILKARIRTVGVFNLCVEVGENKEKTVLVDVGGQRNERKNWSSCFHNVSYVMFVVSLSDFDQMMFEDVNKTRTQDSIELFKNIASTAAFTTVPFFLILNKFDIFKKKIQKNSQAFLEAYPGFTGDVKNEDECIEHIKQTFIQHLPQRSPEAWVEAIPTCAMDQASVSTLFQKIAKKIQDKNQ